MKYAKPMAFFGACVLGWHFVSASGIVNPVLFPGPEESLKAFLEWNASGLLLSDALTSMWRLLAGTTIGIVLGSVTGVAMGRNAAAEDAASPALNMLRAMPPIALLPIMILWFGISDFGKIILVAFGAFFPAWVSGIVGAKSIQPQYLHTAKLFSKSALDTATKIILPATMPFLISGARISIGIGFTLVFASELAGASGGIGYFIANAQIIYRADMMIAGLIVLGLLAASVDYIFMRVTKFAFPWADGT